MTQLLKTKDRETVSAIYDASVKIMTREDMVDEKVLQAVGVGTQGAAGVKREFRTADYFDFSFLRKARAQLTASGGGRGILMLATVNGQTAANRQLLLRERLGRGCR